MRVIRSYSDNEIVDLLRQHGINPTSQRVQITRELYSNPSHLSAEEVYNIVNATVRRNGAADQSVSKATVYNTLGLLADRGVIREVIADPTKIFYDPNITPHHHFYDEVTKELSDIDAGDIHVTGLPSLPEGARLQGIDVIVRLRREKRAVG
ncbi:MAG: hypothetical protein A2637_00225 [Candidatus Muproteobacteria bacterium RIFCSPHIGHO2_01_FULL_65_16]|uniref:Ferric uptake regulation protein n=2 Tax=Candidatus Muproteobacteria TaxID=1817795 RepID=A0A1F6TQ63_9PROT|nr:MAG: hypothetical protein A2637_00225 [Candidatus Muproteobacteria bacterium RIFCSPHIGHO2_01_FULL_65_16]OGI51708.1 MAG: hypothetical protein A3B81_03490 [Candidatus Muproteobacteria bacterium RIFCSPHIGHO2_02_FULL_65_16]